MEIETSEPDISILEGTMFHEVNDLEDKSNVRTRKDSNKQLTKTYNNSILLSL